MSAISTCTPDELMCVSIARCVEDGDVLLEGIAALLPTAGYELARATHAPNAVSLSPIGGVFRGRPVPLSLDRYEEATVEQCRKRFTYGEIALWYLPAYLRKSRARWLEFMRPGQIDREANTNNVVIGSYAAPAVRLPGAVGLPDAASLFRRVFVYVPRHDTRTFVPSVDFCSAPGGLDDARRATPKVVTNLGVFTFLRDGGLLAESLHPGVTSDDVHAATGFAVDIPPHTPTTQAPSNEELRLLREKIDPLGLRRLELVGGAERRALLRGILERDWALV